MKKINKDAFFSKEVLPPKKKKVKSKKEKIMPMPLFKHTIRLKIEGLNQPRLMTVLKNKEGVSLKRVRLVSASIMVVDIAAKDYDKVNQCLVNAKYKNEIVCESGAGVTFKKAVARVGLVVGTLILTTVLVLSEGFIWRVQVSGCENVPQQVVLNLLKEHAVSTGKRLSLVNKTQLRNALNSTDGILESTVEIYGTTVKVQIIEQTPYEMPPLKSEKDILSAYDAEITRIVNYEGTTLVRKGQRVFKGEPLIAAYIMGGDGGEEKVPSFACGKVYGKVVLTQTVFFSTTEYKAERTGKSYQNTILHFFNLKIGKKKYPFENYQSVTDTVNAFSGTFLPIRVERETIYETELQEIQVGVEEKVQQLTEKIVLENIIRCGGNEIETTTALKQITDNYYSLSVFISAEMEIGILQ